MVTEVIMPKSGWTMTEAILAKWFKKEGDLVEKGEALFEFETEKVVTEVEAPATGILRKILAPEGSVVPVAGLVAIITEPDEKLPDLDQIVEKAKITEKPTAKEEIERATEATEERTRISPLAKKLAEEHGIDIKTIKSTDPLGRITKEDVMRAIDKAGAVPSEDRGFELSKVAQIIPLTGVRKTIIERLSQSHLTAIHVTITTEVDMTEITKIRHRLSPEIAEKTHASLSHTDMLVKVVAMSLKEFPIVNSTIEDDEIKIYEDVNVGVAVALDSGLIVPVVRNADKKSLVEIVLCLKELVEKARQNSLSPDAVRGGTITVTNLGMYGVDVFTPIINPPESAILGVGKIAEKPVIVNGQIVARTMMTLSLSFDHRIIDGAVAAQFLKKLKSIIENPEPVFA